MQVEINLDRSERIPYNRNDFPIYIKKDFLSFYPNYTAISHWHDDIELIYIISGKMDYNVNGRITTMQAGEGIFVNTRQIHYGYSKLKEECELICILFHPMLLCSSAYVEQHFVAPVLQNDCFPYFLLQKKNFNANQIISSVNTLFNERSSNLFALKAQSLIFDIWENLFALSGHSTKKQAPRNQHLTILKDMINYIASNYQDKIILEEIAAAGIVSKTTCIHIFVKYTNQTPISYLTEYRLKQSIDLLLTTDNTISEICFEVGFSSASYFTEIFKKSYHCTPSEYRDSHLN